MNIVFRGELDCEPLVVNLGEGAITLALGRDEVVAWDLGGRIYSVWHGGRTVRRGLSGRVLEKWRDESGKHRRVLSPIEADATVAHASRRAAAAADLARHAGGSEDESPVLRALARAAAFDPTVARADASRFASVYGEVGILPPDQYLSLVVQATDGCAFSTCTFCDLYKRPFRPRSKAEFAAHLARVRGYMGDSIALRRRSVFLGAGNALLLPVPRLTALLDEIPRALGAAPPVCGFIDAFTGACKSAADYRELGEHGLRRVYVGLETGHDPLLARVCKPSTRGEVVHAVHAIKRGGLDVGVMVMVGLGGASFADVHAADTIDALNEMPLTPRDFVYFSDMVDAPAAYAESMRAAGSRPLSTTERAAQRQQIESGLSWAGGRPRIATYDLGEFVY